MSDTNGAFVADRARAVRDIIDDAVAGEDEVVVLVAALTMARAIILADVGLSQIEPLRDMVDIGEEFVCVLTDGAVENLHRDAEEAHARRLRRALNLEVKTALDGEAKKRSPRGA